MFSSVSQTKLPPQDNRTLGSSATKAKSSSAFHWLRGREISYRSPSLEQCKTTLMTRNIKANSFSRKEQTCEDPLSLDLLLDAQGDFGVTANRETDLNVHLWDLRTHKIRWIFDTPDHLPDNDELPFSAKDIKIVPRDDDVEKGYVFFVLDSKDLSDNIKQILFKINIKSGGLENVCYLGLVRVTKIMVVGERIFGLSSSPDEHNAHSAKPHFHTIDDNGRPFPLSNTLLSRKDSDFAASEEFLVSTVNGLPDSTPQIGFDFNSQIYVYNIRNKKREILFLGATKLLSDLDVVELFLNQENLDDFPEEVKYRNFMISAIHLAKSRLICGLSKRSSPNDPILCVVDLKTRKIVYKYPPKNFEDSSWKGISIDQLIENKGWVYILYSNQLIAIEWEGERQEILLKHSYLYFSKMILRGNFLFIRAWDGEFFIFDTNTRKLIHKNDFHIKAFAVSNSYCFLYHKVAGESEYRVETWDFLSPKKGDKDDLKSKKRKHAIEDEKSDE